MTGEFYDDLPHGSVRMETSGHTIEADPQNNSKKAKYNPDNFKLVPGKDFRQYDLIFEGECVHGVKSGKGTLIFKYHDEIH